VARLSESARSAIVAVVAGTVASLATVMLVQGNTPAAPVVSAREAQPTRVREKPSPDQHHAFQGPALPHGTVVDAGVPRAAPEESPAIARSEESEEAEIERRDRSFREAFESEGSDPTWANTAARSLADTLLELGTKVGFRVDSTECRTARCVARVTFPDRSTGRASVQPILHALYKPNCAVAIGLPPDNGASAGAEVTTAIRFNCETARTDEAAARD
jgi:hypothetical protein